MLSPSKPHLQRCHHYGDGAKFFKRIVQSSRPTKLLIDQLTETRKFRARDLLAVTLLARALSRSPLSDTADRAETIAKTR